MKVLILFLFLFFNLIQSQSFAQDIVVLSDLEGRRGNVDRQVENGYLRFVGDELQFTDDQTRLIFTGDLFDRGPDSIKLRDWLVGLKKRHPDRVVFIMGNRDYNKLDLIKYYQENKSFKSDLALLTDWFKIKGLNGVFDFHKAELKELMGRPISDAEVASDYIKSVLPGGKTFEFFELGQIAHIEKSGFFAVRGAGFFDHGGITDKNAKKIPDVKLNTNTYAIFSSNLNQWNQSELFRIKMQFAQNKTIESSLIYYGDANWSDKIGAVIPEGSSMMYPDRFKMNGNLRLFSESVLKELLDEKIFFEIVGHTPMGNFPVALKNKDFIRFMLDTSYGANGDRSSVVFKQKGIVEVSATLTTGQKIKYYIDPSKKYHGLLADDFHVAGQLENGDYLLFKYYEGFKLNELIVPAKDFVGKYSMTEVGTGDADQLEFKQKLVDYLKKSKSRILEIEELREQLLHSKKKIYLNSGASKFSFDGETQERIVRRDAREFFAKLDGSHSVYVDGGTMFGVEKIYQEELANRNYELLESGKEQIEYIAFIIDQTNPDELSKQINKIIVAGHDWHEPLFKALELVHEFKGTALFTGGGGVVRKGIRKAAALGVDYRLSTSVHEGASVEYAKYFPEHGFDSMAAMDLNTPTPKFQTALQVKKSYQMSGKKSLTFFGFSGAGYENPAEVDRWIKKIITQFDPLKTIITIGGTFDGIGRGYKVAKELEAIGKFAQALKDKGFETRGILSKLGMEAFQDYLRVDPETGLNALEYYIKYIDFTHLVDGESWGGYTSPGVLSEVSQAMVTTADYGVIMSGGQITLEEGTELAKIPSSRMIYVKMKMNKLIAEAKARKNSKLLPSDADLYGPTVALEAVIDQKNKLRIKQKCIRIVKEKKYLKEIDYVPPEFR